MTYEEHLESMEKGQKAEANLQAARELLQEAAIAQQKALSNYQQILEQGKSEITAELKTEAYLEYKQYLQEEAAKASQAEDYELASAIFKKLSLLKEDYEKAVPVPSNPLLVEIEAILQKRQITDKADRQHFINRANYLFRNGLSDEKILKAIENELDNRPKIMASAGWTGFSGK